MSVIINEWLPDPAGADAEGEFIELFNSGEGAQILSGWSIKDKSGKEFNLTGKTIGARDFLILPYKETKITLNNQDEEVVLLRKGEAVDKASFSGPAPSGQSFSRAGDTFFFSEPTPGAANTVPVSAEKPQVEAIATSNMAGAVGTAVVLGLLFGVMAGYVYKIVIND